MHIRSGQPEAAGLSTDQRPGLTERALAESPSGLVERFVQVRNGVATRRIA
jgi:hypothetical protein